MICYYIDHETYDGDAKTLARLSVEYKRANFIHHQKGISLLTCHRAEFYLPKESEVFTKDVPHKFCAIRDTGKAYTRLFEIALGLHSQIIGESSIFQQVSQSVNAYLYHSPDPILLEILRKAREIRETFDFYAPNHGQLIYDVFNKSGNSQTLFLVGAGMLNYKILSSLKSVTTYSSVILITRDIKRAKEKYAHFDGIKLKSMSDIDTEKINGKFDVILATNEINEEYAKNIVQLCRIKQCTNIADLSSIPIEGLSDFEIDKNYYSLFTENTKNLIETNNRVMIRKKNLVLDYLAQNISNLYE